MICFVLQLLSLEMALCHLRKKGKVGKPTLLVAVLNQRCRFEAFPVRVTT